MGDLMIVGMLGDVRRENYFFFRQITASIAFLPLLEQQCSFDSFVNFLVLIKMNDFRILLS
uniref:Uncharacterized protein n=1 Tax=Parascaris equorum TaxID=6256 RepID=A0A914R1N7_PAREQ